MSDLIDRQAAIKAIEQMQLPIMRSDFFHEQFIFRGLSEARQAIIDLPSVQQDVPDINVGELISRQAAIDVLEKGLSKIPYMNNTDEDMIRRDERIGCIQEVRTLPSAQPERLTDDDFETIRIHLNAFKETLCNQQRWEEAEEYQRIIDRFMAFASEQPRKGKWISICNGKQCNCSICGEGYDHTYEFIEEWNFCPNCGADMRGDSHEGSD